MEQTENQTAQASFLLCSQKGRLSCMKRTIWIIAVALFLSAALLLLIANRSDWFFRPVDAGRVVQVNISIGLPEHLNTVTLNDSENISRVISLEEFVRRNDGVNRFIKSPTLQIDFEYILENGKSVFRSYKGNKHYVKLIEQARKIPSVNQVLE